MCLTATGAWFTDKAATSNEATVVKFGTVDISIESSTQVLHEDNTAADFLDANSNSTHDAGEYYLLQAGDKIVSTITYTNLSDVACYYVIKNGDNYYKIVSNNLVEITESEPDAGDHAAAVLLATDTVNFGVVIPTTAMYGDNYTVNGVQGTITRGGVVTTLAGTYEIRVIQQANVESAAAAYDLLVSSATNNGVNWAGVAGYTA